MRQFKRLGILRFLAVIEISLFIFVAALSLRSRFFGQTKIYLPVSLYFLMVILGFTIGRILFMDDSLPSSGNLAKTKFFKFLTFILKVKEKELFIAKVMGVISTLIPIFTAYLLFGKEGILRLIFEIIMAVIPYRIALNFSGKHYQDIMTKGVVYFGFGIFATALIVSSFYIPLSGLKSILMYIFYVYIYLFLFLMNQEDIDSNIYSKKYIQKSILPRNMRSFNFIAISVLYAVIILMFNLKSLMAVVLSALAKFSALAMLCILWLISFLFPKGSQQGQNGGQEPELPREPAGNTNSILDIILYILMTLLIIYMVYKLAPLLLKKLVELFAKIVEFIRKVTKTQITGKNDTGEYDDESETIRPPKESRTSRSIKRKTNRVWKELNKIGDPIERVRYLYGLMLINLDTLGIDRTESDTVNEIYKKSENRIGDKRLLKHITHIYQKVRYGNVNPGKDELDEYEDNCRKLQVNRYSSGR